MENTNKPQGQDSNNDAFDQTKYLHEMASKCWNFILDFDEAVRNGMSYQLLKATLDKFIEDHPECAMIFDGSLTDSHDKKLANPRNEGAYTLQAGEFCWDIITDLFSKAQSDFENRQNLSDFLDYFLSDWAEYEMWFRRKRGFMFDRPNPNKWLMGHKSFEELGSVQKIHKRK